MGVHTSFSVSIRTELTRPFIIRHRWLLGCSTSVVYAGRRRVS